MSEYFDTPALVFACGKSSLADPAWKLICDSPDPVTIPHALAECFNSLTYRLGFPPAYVQKAMEKNLHRIRFIVLDQEDYKAAIDSVIKNGLTGDKIYDALHVRGAAKAGASKIYTSNRRDFAPLTQIPIQRIGS